MLLDHQSIVIESGHDTTTGIRLFTHDGHEITGMSSVSIADISPDTYGIRATVTFDFVALGRTQMSDTKVLLDRFTKDLSGMALKPELHDTRKSAGLPDQEEGQERVCTQDEAEAIRSRTQTSTK